MTLPKGSRSVSAIAWSSDARYIAAADMSDDHNIHVFDTQTLDKKNKATKIATQKSDRNKIFMIEWKPDTHEFVSVGVKHYCHWTLNGNTLKYKKGALSSIKTAPGKSMGFSSVAYSAKSQAFLAGGSDGTVYFWKGTSISGKEKAHKKMVSSVNACPKPDGDEYVMTGSSENQAKVWLNKGGQKLECKWTLSMDGAPRSMDYICDKEFHRFLVGTSYGSIVELKAKVT